MKLSLHFSNLFLALHSRNHCVYLIYYIYTINTTTLIQCNHKIAVIIVFFGQWPNWIHYFIKSCSNSSDFQFLIFSDNQIPKRFNNITCYELSLDEFSELVSNKLGLKAVINEAYKVCDFKPAYGKIFEDYLNEYSFWGYSDVDLIFGDIVSHGIHSLLDQNDVLSFYSGFASGPFILFRNRTDIKLLYTQVKNYKTILENPKYMGFDEHIIKPENIGFNFKKLILFLAFVPQFLISLKKGMRTLNQFKYEFQWYVKKKTISEPVDISEVILLLNSQNKIKARFRNRIFNDSDYNRNSITNWEVYYKNRKLTDNMGNSHAIFHFIGSKKKEDFIIEEFKINTENFKISTNGIGPI
jgi:hypothetical protein